MPDTQTFTKTGPEFLVDTQTSGNQNYPVVTGLANGGFVVTWQDGLAAYDGSGSGTLGDDSYSSIKAQIYAADGSKVGSEFLVNSQTEDGQATPVITGLANGGFVVTWQDQHSTSGDIKAQIYNANGATVGTEFRVNTTTANNQNTPTISSLPNGGFVVAWTSVNPDYSAGDIKAQVYDANGAKVGGEFLVNAASTSTSQERTSIATLSNGDFIVTWNDDRSGNWQVRGQVFHPTASGATKVGSEIIVDTAFYNSQMVSPAVGLANGNFVVTWEGTNGDIKAQVFNATGTAVGSSFTVNTQTDGSQGFPDITALTNGDFVVTWHDEGSPSDGSGSSIKAQVYDVNGNKIGAEFLVNSQTNGVQYYPSVAALANGGFVITWGDFSQAIGDASSYGIAGQIFNLSDTTPPDVAVSGYDIDTSNLPVVTVNGTAEANSSVAVYDGTTLVGTITAGADGSWSLSGVTLAEGANSLSAKATDAAGNVGTSAAITGPTVVSTTTAEIASSTTTDYIVYNTGVLNIDTGAAASGEVVIGNGGTVFDYGAATNSLVLSGGVEHVYYGGAASNTTVEADGYLDVATGGVTTGTVLHGYQQVLAGGTANGTTIDNGGGSVIQIGGVANDTHIVNGTEYVKTGGVQNGVDFEGGTGTLLVDDISGIAGTISNFEVGDSIDILNLNNPLFGFTATSVVFATGNGDVTLHFDNKQANTVWNIVDDGHGGTRISLSLISQFSASLTPDAGSEDSLTTQDTTQQQPLLAHA